MAVRQWKEHQEYGAQYLVNRVKKRKGGYLFMEMRTGKSWTVLEAIKRVAQKKIHKPFPLLIVAPKTPCIATWPYELEMAGFNMAKVCNLSGLSTAKTKKALEEQTDKRIFIINYDKIVPSDILEDYKWNCVVLDESVRVAKHTAKVTKEVMATLPRNRYQMRVALSGAPAGEGYFSLICQRLSTDGEIGGEREYFRHLKKEWKHNIYLHRWDPRAGTIGEVDKWLGENTYRLTQKQAGVVSERMYTRMVLPLPEKLQKVMGEMYGTERYERDGRTLSFTELTRTTADHMIANGLHWHTGEVLDGFKVEAVCEAIEETGTPALVFCRYVEQVKSTYEMLKRMKIPVWKIDGATQTNEREDIRSMFQQMPGDKPAVVVAQTTTVKMGIDLSRADTIYYLSSSFSFDDRVQSESRATHLNKTKPVQIVDVITEGTVEPEVVKALESKESWNARAMEAYLSKKEKK